MNLGERGAWLVGLAMAAAIVSGPPARAASPCQLQEIGELDVKVEGAAFIVPVQIDGRPARMVIDTGAFATTIFRRAAPSLDLTAHPMRELKVYGVGGEAGASETQITDFRLGGMAAKNVTVLVSGHHTRGDTVGLVGAPFLTQSDVEFDVPHGKIRFFRPKGCSGDQVVYWGQAYARARMAGDVDNHEINVMVQVNGRPLLAQMDSGASHSVLTTAAAAAAGVTPTSAGVASAGGSTGLGATIVDTYIGVFPAFAFGDETIRNARLEIANLFGKDKEVGTGSNIASAVISEPQMLLGADFFQAHRIYVAMSQRMVYASYEGGPVFTIDAAAAPAPVSPPKAP